MSLSLCVFVYMCAGIHWVLKSLSEPTELQMINVSCLCDVSARNWALALRKNGTILTDEASLQPRDCIIALFYFIFFFSCFF